MSGLLAFSAIFRDVHDLVLEDEQIRRTLARQPHHVLVVVLDQSADDLAVHQFDRNRFLFFPQGLEEGRFLKRLLRRRRPAAFGIRIPVITAERHAGIVHKARSA